MVKPDGRQWWYHIVKSCAPRMSLSLNSIFCWCICVSCNDFWGAEGASIGIHTCASVNARLHAWGCAQALPEHRHLTCGDYECVFVCASGHPQTSCELSYAARPSLHAAQVCHPDRHCLIFRRALMRAFATMCRQQMTGRCVLSALLRANA